MLRSGARIDGEGNARSIRCHAAVREPRAIVEQVFLGSSAVRYLQSAGMCLPLRGQPFYEPCLSSYAVITHLPFWRATVSVTGFAWKTPPDLLSWAVNRMTFPLTT